MAKTKKTDKRSDIVMTGHFKKTVRVAIDPEEAERKSLENTKLCLKIRRIQKKIRPDLQEITELRSKSKALLEDIESETTEQEALVYEKKNFRSGEATTYLVDGDVKVGTRTLEKADYQVDAEDSEAEEAEDAAE